MKRSEEMIFSAWPACHSTIADETPNCWFPLTVMDCCHADARDRYHYEQSVAYINGMNTAKPTSIKVPNQTKYFPFHKKCTVFTKFIKWNLKNLTVAEKKMRIWEW